jgi:hypothetical protein
VLLKEPQLRAIKGAIGIGLVVDYAITIVRGDTMQAHNADTPISSEKEFNTPLT